MVKIDIPDAYEELLEELREHGDSDPDEDLRQLVMDAIHNGVRELDIDNPKRE
jgi:hypothetical protein